MPNLAMTPFGPRLPKDRPRDIVIGGSEVDMLFRILLSRGLTRSSNAWPVDQFIVQHSGERIVEMVQ